MKTNSKNILFMLGIILLAGLNRPVSAKTQIDAETEPGTEAGNSHASDYESYSDDEESPAEQIVQSKNTLKPYFIEEKVIEYVTPGSEVVLACPVQNYDDSKHQILWFKEKKPITNGETPLSNAYILDKSFNLKIVQYTDETPGNYYCNVMCGDDCHVQQQILVIVGDRPTTTPMMPPSVTPDTASNSKEHMSSSLALVITMAILNKLYCI